MFAMNDATIRPADIKWPEYNHVLVHTRGAVIQRVFAHDVWHAAELNEALAGAGLPPVVFWD